MKATAWAPVNLALIKYWGKKDARLRLPANSSLSVCLKNLGTKTTVEWRKDFDEDMVVIDGEEAEGRKYERVVAHLDRVRKMAGMRLKAKVVSRNNFPMSVGLSSSASGLAALSLAASKAAGLDLTEKNLSRLARLGSGSACRSIPDGWVEWVKGSSDETSFAKQIFAVDHWDVRVLVVLLSQKEKRVSSTDGQAVATTSPFYKTRIEMMEERLNKMKQVIQKKDFSGLGRLLEDEALNMHAVMLTSKPNLIYWLPETVRVIGAIQQWREMDWESYFTINTGQNVFVLCQPEDEDELVKKLNQVEGVKRVIREKIGRGAKLI